MITISFALEAGDDRLVGRIARFRVAYFAKVRIRFQHDLLAATPFLEPVRSGTYRVCHYGRRGVAVCLDHLARHRRGRRERQVRQKLGVREVELQAQRVAVDRLQAFDPRVVIELAGLRRLRLHAFRADEALVEQPEGATPHTRIEPALPGEDVILRDQLALAAFERGIVGEVDARLDPDRPGLPVGADLWQRRRRVRYQLQRPREMIVRVQWIEDHAVDRVAEEVADCLRIESGLRGQERHPQHLVHVGLRERGSDKQCECRCDRTSRQGSVRSHWRRSAPASLSDVYLNEIASCA
jgi:hypothetical protein